MKSWKFSTWLSAAALLFIPAAAAQEAHYGFEAPVTFSGGLLAYRNASPNSQAAISGPGMRATVYPQLKLGDHWFALGAIQADAGPTSYERAADGEREIHAEILQAYVGYARTWGSTAIVVKGGKLLPAFGSFPLRYDEMVNPLVDVPVGYGYYYRPVNLASLGAVEADLSVGRTDVRFQLANSAPMNPQSFRSDEQHLNWEAGAGYTIRQGFRVGVSGHRGPYITSDVSFLARQLSPGQDPAGLPGTGIGLDVQWARGRWSVNGEFQRFQYDYTLTPTMVAYIGYVETKVSLSPRFYAAWRIGAEEFSRLQDRFAAEAVLGMRLSRFQLIKFGYQRVQLSEGRTPSVDGIALRYVLRFDRLRQSFN